jgi:HK97 family phage major capsid protein
VSEYDDRVKALTKQVTELASELRDKDDIGLDRITAIEDEITTKSAEIDKIVAEKRAKDVEDKLAALDDQLKAYTRETSRTKAAAILAGAGNAPEAVKAVGRFSETNFLSALVERRNGDQDAAAFVKAVLGTSSATGTAVVPNNFVGSLVEQIALNNPYRRIFNVQTGITGAGVDIPYEVTAVTAALLQGAYGSNKDVRDWSFNRATATLYTIAQIADVGNQLLRQSNGAAEASARRRLAASIGLKEAQLITNGSGSSEPLGFFQAFLAFGDPAGFKTTLSSESRAAALGRGMSALEARGISTQNLVIVMHPDRLLGTVDRDARLVGLRWLGDRSRNGRGGQPAGRLGVGRAGLPRRQLAVRPGRHGARDRPLGHRHLHRGGVPDRCQLRGGLPLRPEHHGLPRGGGVRVQRGALRPHRPGAEGHRHLVRRLRGVGHNRPASHVR